jgi:hypothetical protein
MYNLPNVAYFSTWSTFCTRNYLNDIGHIFISTIETLQIDIYFNRNHNIE